MINAKQDTHQLYRGDEDDVEHEESYTANLLLDEHPSVVLAPDLIAASSPVVVCQPQRPHCAESQHIVQSRRFQAIETSPDRVVEVEQRGQDGPHPVDLAVVFVDFRCDPEERKCSQGQGETEDGRVCGHVDLLEGFQVA